MVFSFTFFSYHLLQFSLSLFRYRGTVTWTNCTPTLWAGLLQIKLFFVIFLQGIRSIGIWPFAKRRVVTVVFWQRIWIIQIDWLITKSKTKQRGGWGRVMFLQIFHYLAGLLQKKGIVVRNILSGSGSSSLAGLKQRRWFCTRTVLQSIFFIRMGWPVATWVVLNKIFFAKHLYQPDGLAFSKVDAFIQIVFARNLYQIKWLLEKSFTRQLFCLPSSNDLDHSDAMACSKDNRSVELLLMTWII